MAAPRSSPSPQSLSASGDANISLFLDSDLGTHLLLSAAADSTFGVLKAQVAVEHAASFPAIGPVVVKSFEVQLRGAMYHLCDSMLVKNAFSKAKAENFLHVKMATAETDTHHRRDEDRGRSSDVMLKGGGEDDGARVTVHAHDVHQPSSSQQNTERKSTIVCLPTDVRTTEGVYVNSTSVTLVGNEVDTREENLVHMDDLSEENDCKKARVTGSFDRSAVDPIGETDDSKTRDVENLDKLPLETSTNSHGVLSSTSCQGVDGDVKEDSLKLENPTIARKNKRKKKSQSVTSKGVYAQELTEPSTGAVEVPKSTAEDLLHGNQGLQGNDGRTKSTKRQRKKVSLKHVPTDSGKAIQSLGDQARLVPAKDLKGESNKAVTQFQHAGCSEPSDLPESHVHKDKTSLADHVGTGNVGMPSVSAQNMNIRDGNVKKGKSKSKRKSDLVKPESLETYGGSQDTDNCPQGFMHSDVQKGRVEQGNAKENTDEVIIQNDSSMLQQETEDATRDSTLENKPLRSLSAAENLDKHPLEASTNSHGVLTSTCQQGLDGNVKEHSVQPENPIITQKNKKRKKSQSVTSKGVCAHELTEPSTGAVEVPKATGEDLLHENQGLEGDGASDVGMTIRDETNAIPPDMLIFSSSKQNSGSQVSNHVQLGTDA